MFRGILYVFEWLLLHLGFYRFFVFIHPKWIPLIGFQDYPFDYREDYVQLLKKGKIKVAGRIVSLQFYKISYSPVSLYIHSFSWVYFILPFHNEENHTLFLKILEQWLKTPKQFQSLTIRNKLVRERLKNFILINNVWERSLPKKVETFFYKAFNYDVIFLERTLKLLPSSKDQFYTLSLLILTRILFFHPNRNKKTGYLGNMDLEIYLNKFFHYLKKMTLPDGMHVSVDLYDHFEVFKYLVLIREALIRMDYTVPPLIQQVLDRMGPVVKFFIMTDGKSGIFYNNTEQSEHILDWYLTKSSSSGRPGNILRYAGFVRITNPYFSMLIHTGSSHQKHRFGTGSFMVALKSQRLIVNCGRPFGINKDIFPLFPLQSVATFNKGYIKLYLKDYVFTDDYTFLLLEGALTSGGMYRRYFYISMKEFDIRGEDEFVITKGGAKDYKIHFHFAPNVSISILRNFRKAILKIPSHQSTSHSLKSLYYMESNRTLSVEKSVYSGEEGIYNETHQIIISGIILKPQIKVKWRLYKVP